MLTISAIDHRQLWILSVLCCILGLQLYIPVQYSYRLVYNNLNEGCQLSVVGFACVGPTFWGFGKFPRYNYRRTPTFRSNGPLIFLQNDK